MTGLTNIFALTSKSNPRDPGFNASALFSEIAGTRDPSVGVRLGAENTITSAPIASA